MMIDLGMMTAEGVPDMTIGINPSTPIVWINVVIVLSDEICWDTIIYIIVDIKAPTHGYAWRKSPCCIYICNSVVKTTCLAMHHKE